MTSDDYVSEVCPRLSGREERDILEGEKDSGGHPHSRDRLYPSSSLGVVHSLSRNSPHNGTHRRAIHRKKGRIFRTIAVEETQGQFLGTIDIDGGPATPN